MATDLEPQASPAAESLPGGSPSPSQELEDDCVEDLGDGAATGAKARELRKQRKEAAEAERRKRLAERVAARRGGGGGEIEVVSTAKRRKAEKDDLKVVAVTKAPKKDDELKVVGVVKAKPKSPPRGLRQKPHKRQLAKMDKALQGDVALCSPAASPEAATCSPAPATGETEVPAEELGPAAEMAGPSPSPAASPKAAAAAAADKATGPKEISVTAVEGIGEMGWMASAPPPGPVLIKSVMPGSWAEKSGLQVGDRLMSVNNREIAQLTKDDMKAALRNRPVSCVFKRGEDLPAGENGGGANGKTKKKKKDKKILTQAELDQKRIKKEKKLAKERRRNRRNAKKLKMNYKNRETFVVLKSIEGDQLLRETLQANPKMRHGYKKGRKADQSSSGSRSPCCDDDDASSYSSSISSSSSSISESSSASSEARKMAKEMAKGPAASFAFERPIPLKPADEISLLPTRAGVGMGGGMGASLAALGPGAATNAEVEAFLVASLVDPFAAAKLRGIAPALQKQVMAKGPISGVKNPSSVLLARVRDAEMGVLQPSTAPTMASMGLTPMMFKACNDPQIENLIKKYKLDMRAAGMLRSLPPDERRVALTIDLEQTHNPSQFIIMSLQTGHKLTGATPWQAKDTSTMMANFGGKRGNEGADSSKL
eukprot:TRINITY_DN4994_c0_g1_i1.p1 TRINITY_DN4994_c0_g1~~TRINITY_DN4994_c0_g1_i1.p1  ORF type:complete len:656 (-),score=216.59 TRINITY_DN4994_c0_g1_i1:51-2018(-)